MAGDWIKMRLDLQTHPKVVRILSVLRPKDVGTITDKFRVLGGLHAVWGVFDTHTTDGRLVGYTPELLDHIIGWPGFSEAMIEVDWLHCEHGQALVLPDFSEHNGKSAKRRAEDTKRKRDGRSCPHSVRILSDSSADELRTREEKRREELTTTTTDVVVVASAADDRPPPTRIKPDCPHQQIIALYHEILPMCPEVRDWTPARATQLRARWNEDEKRQSLDYWRAFFEYVKSCPFLVGQQAAPGRRAFIADLEWLTKSNNFAKVREGRYEQ